MRNVLAIIDKELRSYFVSPIAYVVLTGFLLLGGWFFFNLLSNFIRLLTLYLQFQGAQGAEAAKHAAAQKSARPADSFAVCKEPRP